ncbi:MAG: sodium/proline symporter [Nannocystaceae bacterium]|nr:sodium/proline symporter [bacterium]
MSETTAIIITLVVYKVALLGIGLVAQARTRSAGDFFLGGRSLGPWVAGLSASASSSSAWSLLGVSGFAYAKGVSAVWLFPACIGGFWLNWYVLAPALRRVSLRSGALTVTELLAGPRDAAGSRVIRRVCTAIVLVSLMAYVASQFQGAGKTFAETFDMPMAEAVLLGSAVVVVYTMLGGFLAVSITDTLQGFVMALASIALPVAAWSAVGGWQGLSGGVAAVSVPGYLSLVQGMPTAAAIGFVLGLLGIGLGYPGQPHVVNRFMAVRDDDALRQARIIAMGWAVILYAGMIVLGLCARVMLPPVGDGEVAFVAAARFLFPPVVAGVVLAAVLSAIMSTADSQLLVAASAVVHDLPETQDEDAPRMVRRSRAVVVGLSAAAVVAALYGDASIFDKVLFAWTAMGAAFGPLLLVLVVGGPVRANARLAAIVVGFSSAVIAYSIPGAAGTAWERVLPFVLALAIAWSGRDRAPRDEALAQR